MLKTNNILKERVIDLDYKGSGYVILENKYVYIDNVLPNELITFKIIKNNKRFAIGELIEIIKPSKDRIGVASNLGSIIFDHASLDLELKWQKKVTKNTFKKVFKKDFNVKDTITDNIKYNYRNKSTFHVLNKKQITLGLFEKKSKNLIRVDNLNLSNINANKLINEINNSDIVIDYKIFKHLSVKNDINNNLLVTIVAYEKDFKGLNDLVDFIKQFNFIVGITINIKDNNYEILGSKSYLLYGKDYLTYNDFLITDKSFMQINYKVMDLTYKLIKENIIGNKIVDLYSGIGSIILSVLDQDKTGVIVENNKENIKLAKQIVKTKNFDNIKIIEDDATNVVANLTGDTFIVDPPQAGLGLEFIKNILKVKPKRLIYLSCNLNTLINDLKIIKNHYSILKVYPIRMFPNTSALETLVILDLN